MLPFIALSDEGNRVSEEALDALGHIAGSAGAHYCACTRWPVTFAELADFDKKRNESSGNIGGNDAPRIDWQDLSKSVIYYSEQGRFSISIRSSNGIVVDIEIPEPDCSHIDPNELRQLCPAEDQST